MQEEPLAHSMAGRPLPQGSLEEGPAEEAAGTLALLVGDLLAIGREHRKCLSCHCYRDIAEQALGAAPGWVEENAVDTRGGARSIRETNEVGPKGSASLERSTALRRLLSTSTAGHG